MSAAEVVVGKESRRLTRRSGRTTFVNRPIDVVTGRCVVADVEDLVRVRRKETGVVVTGYAAADEVRFSPHYLRVVTHSTDGTGSTIVPKRL